MDFSVSASAIVELGLGLFILAAGSAVIVRPRLARRLRGWRNPRAFGLCCLSLGGSLSAAGIGDAASSLGRLGLIANIVALVLLVVAAVIAHVYWPYRNPKGAE